MRCLRSKFRVDLVLVSATTDSVLDSSTEDFRGKRENDINGRPATLIEERNGSKAICKMYYNT